MKYIVNFFKSIKNHISFWSESYFIFPIIILATSITIWLFHFFTEKPIADRPDFLIGTLYNCIKVSIAAMLTAWIQNALFGYRSNHAGVKKLEDDIYDAVVTIIMFVITLYCIWN